MNLRESILSKTIVTDVWDYQVCKDCRYAFFIEGGPEIGTRCCKCGSVVESGMAFFQGGSISIIELLQESYCAIKTTKERMFDFPVASERAHVASVLVFFCTMRELLLEQFLFALMEYQDLLGAETKDLAARNDSHSRRMTNLFPTLTKLKWEDALCQLDLDGSKGYAVLDARLKELADQRNSFLHDGEDWEMSVDLAERCVSVLFPLLDFYIALNNHFVHQLAYAKVNAAKTE